MLLFGASRERMAMATGSSRFIARMAMPIGSSL